MNVFRRLRKSKGLTQAELGKLLNISPSTIGMYEQGRRTPDKDILLAMSNYFQVSIDYLLGNEPSFTVAHADKLPDKVVPITQLIMKMFHDEPEILEQLTGIKEIYGMEKLLNADINNMPEEQFQTIKFALKAGLKAVKKK